MSYTSTWRPAAFRRALADRDMTVPDLHRRMASRLTDVAPTMAAIYTWTRADSSGPSRYFWIQALSNILGLDQANLFTKGRRIQ